MVAASFGRAFIVYLWIAGVTAMGFILTVLDVIGVFGGSHRRVIAVAWFIAFVFCMGGVVVKLLQRIATLEGTINALAAAGPRIKFLKVGGPSSVRLTKRSVEIWQLWFVNDPEVRGSLAVARRLTAEVQFSNADGGRPFDAFVGQWVITQKPDHVGWGGPHEQRLHDSIKNEIDLALSPARGKLMLIGQDDKKAIEPTGEVHALSGENIHAKPAHFRHSKYLLAPDITRVLVRLAAENMPEQQFQFAITRNLGGRVSSISEIKP